MHNSLKCRQIKKWRMLAFCLLIGFSAFAQKEEPTKLLRIDKNKDDIQFLDSMYNIENVSMDQVFYVEYQDSLQTNVLKPISTQSSDFGVPKSTNVNFNIPTATPVSNNNLAVEKDKNPPPSIQVQEPTKNTANSTSSTSQRRSSTRSTKSRSKKMKMRRVRLKKKKRSPRSSKGRCYRF